MFWSCGERFLTNRQVVLRERIFRSVGPIRLGHDFPSDFVSRPVRITDDEKTPPHRRGMERTRDRPGWVSEKATAFSEVNVEGRERR